MASPALKKRFGQHHLRDGQLCWPLLEFLAIDGDRVLEIGPGGGVLTAELLAAGARVLACEVDPEWAFTLRRRLGEPGLAHPALRVAVVDVLEIDYARLPRPTLVTGNLPFNVATRIVSDLLPHAERVPRAAFMVQKEVAERLVARPGTKAYGAMSVLVEAQARARYLGTVRPGSFRPPPKVSAAFVGLDLRAPPVGRDDMPDFERLVRIAFAMRRKTLRNCLAAALGREVSEALLAELGLDSRCRAEELELGTFVEMFRVWRSRG